MASLNTKIYTIHEYDQAKVRMQKKIQTFVQSRVIQGEKVKAIITENTKILESLGIIAD